MTFWALDEIRHLGASEGHCGEDTGIVRGSLPSPIDSPKEVISDNLLLWAKPLIQDLGR